MDNLYEVGEDLESKLEDVIHIFEDERRAFWSDDDAEETDFLFLVDGVGNQILRAARMLIEPTPNEDFPAKWGEGVEGIANHPAFSREILERVQIAVAGAMSLGTDQRAKRCVELTNVLVRNAPGNRVMASLQRVTRSYIVGFYPECIILCRAVIESAIRDAFDRNGMPLPEKSDTTMRNRLDTLVGNLRCLSPEKGTAAKAIWDETSKVAHGKRKWQNITNGDALRIITESVEVLQDLYDREL